MWHYELALGSVTLVWGTTFVVVGSLVAQVPPGQVLVVRFALAAALLCVLASRNGRHLRAAFRHGGVALGLWLAAGFGLQTVGLAYTTPARSAFITGFCVVVPPLVAAAGRRRLPDLRVLAAAAMAGLGVGLIGWPGSSGRVNLGDVLTGLCAFAYGIHIHATGRYAARTRADALTAAQITIAAAAFALACGAAVAAIRLAPLGDAPAWAVALAGRPWSWSATVLARLLYLALFATVLAYYLQTWGQQRVPPARAGTLFALEPLVAAVISCLFGMESVTPRLVAGGALVLMAIVTRSSE